ncbi:MAG TPA: 4Fe-4S dicluster domain-containing protein [Thermodesulfovibrionales bacterium]|nr:4Fe-4S dicluster domain-containing protein [Thermodesulfovibrionales bacterium]
MTTIRRIQPLRRIVEILQAVLIIGIPFLTINGESALRFDIPSLRLHVFGVSLWMDEFFLFLIAIIFVTFFTILVTLMFGRIWCGWACPQTVLVDFTRFLDKAYSKGVAYRLMSYVVTFLISLIVAANLIWYFVSPYEFFQRLYSGSLGNIIAGFWIVMTAIAFLNLLLLRHSFCATVCPYAKLQSVLFDRGTLIIAFDPRRQEECMNCMACVTACPVGIDIRKGENAACVSCAECIDACSRMMWRRQKKSLIDYFFGSPGDRLRVFRQNVLLTASLTIIFFFLFLYLSISRIPLDMVVLPHYDFPPRILADGKVVNSYILSLENKSRTEKEVALQARRSKGLISLTPERVHLSAGEYKKVSVYVTVSQVSLGTTSEDIEIFLESEGRDTVIIRKGVRFTIPNTQ